MTAILWPRWTMPFVHLTITISNICLDQFQYTKLYDFFLMLDTLFLSRKQLQYGQKRALNFMTKPTYEKVQT